MKRAALIVLLDVIAGVLAGILTQRALGPHGLAASWPSVVEGGASYTRVTFHTPVAWTARLAPDGKNVLYATTRGGRSEVVRSTIGQPSILPTSIAGDLLDVSPRGELAVASEDGTLSRVHEGSGPRAVAAGVTAATWLPDDTLAIIRGGTKLEYPIGKVLAETTTGRFDLLRASPRGDRFAFADHPAASDSRMVLRVPSLRSEITSKPRPHRARSAGISVALLQPPQAKA